MTGTAGTAAVVVLSRRLGAVLPAGAARLLRAGAALWADTDLPDDLAAECGAEPIGDVLPDGVHAVLDGATPDGATLDELAVDHVAVDDAVPDAVRGVLLTLDCHTGLARHWVAAGAVTLRTPEPPGARLLDAVAVMDRLRSPGGCLWDAEQTHRSLMPYLIEETYELYQALEDDDPAALREELGDVLLQVLFHARIAQESAEGFDVDAVATDLVTKLVGRHPHVFTGSEQVRTAAEQEVRWEQLKHTEKCRESIVDGVALAQPALALAAKLVARTAKAGVPPDLLFGSGAAHGDVGEALFALAGTAKLAGHDPEAALRTVARGFAEQVRAAEGAARAAGREPRSLTPEQWHGYWPRRYQDEPDNHRSD